MDKKECSRENKESERSDRASGEKKQYKHVLLGTSERSESDHLICYSTVADQFLKVLWIGRNGEGRFLSSSGTSIQAR